MKDRWRERFPACVPWPWRALLQARKMWRQSLTRWQEYLAARRPLDPLLGDGEPAEPLGERVFAPNPREAITKCARWYEEDLQQPDIKAVIDQLQALQAELTAKGLRFTNAAGPSCRRGALTCGGRPGTALMMPGSCLRQLARGPLGAFAALLAFAALPPRVDAGVACSVPRSRPVFSAFAPSTTMARLFRERRRSHSSSTRSPFIRNRFGSPRFGSRQFGATRFGASRSSGLAGGRMGRLFSASHARLSSRKFFSLTPTCHPFGGR